MQEIVIRNFTENDRNFVRQLCCDTAFSGKPVEKFLDGRNIIADILTGYFMNFEPESIFIAEIGGKRVGYLTGSKNIRRQKKIFTTRILPHIFLKIYFTGAFLKKKNLLFVYNCAKSFFRKELFDPDFSGQFPATLHINVDTRYRNMGVGEKLINHYCRYLKKEKVNGIVLTTVSENAVRFFQKMGFLVLHKQKISYYSYLTGEKFFRFTMGKSLL